ncbi:MAG: 4a-hydroxytetrahydrobiopterin dehydratase [Candidatus Kapaibacterium sp.]|jgi:4a-hydroxytetrahydrobiopterin dehydratase
MARPELLSPELIQRHLEFHPSWRLEGNDVPPQRIVRELHAANWPAAVGIVNAIAIVAETMDHHPDILLFGWNKIRVTLTTHDRGGLTDLDFALADKIDEMNGV